MTKKNRKRRARARRKERNSRKGDAILESTQPSTLRTKEDADARAANVPAEVKPSVLTNAIRVTGIAPIAVLVVALASHDVWPWRAPQWFQSIADMEVAVLTLSAGHAGIIGLLISNKGRFTWSTYALFLAAVATAVAGIRTIGDSTPGLVVALMLIFLTVPAVWADALSTNMQRFWGFLRSRRVVFTILIAIAVVIAVYNQSKDKDYIRDWILIPFGIVAGVFVVAAGLWLLFKLSHRYVPILFSWLRSRTSAAYRRVTRCRNKQ